MTVSRSVSKLPANSSKSRENNGERFLSCDASLLKLRIGRRIRAQALDALGPGLTRRSISSMRSELLRSPSTARAALLFPERDRPQFSTANQRHGGESLHDKRSEKTQNVSKRMRSRPGKGAHWPEKMESRARRPAIRAAQPSPCNQGRLLPGRGVLTSERSAEEPGQIVAPKEPGKTNQHDRQQNEDRQLHDGHHRTRRERVITCGSCSPMSMKRIPLEMKVTITSWPAWSRNLSAPNTRRAPP